MLLKLWFNSIFIFLFRSKFPLFLKIKQYILKYTIIYFFFYSNSFSWSLMVLTIKEFLNFSSSFINEAFSFVSCFLKLRMNLILITCKIVLVSNTFFITVSWFIFFLMSAFYFNCSLNYLFYCNLSSSSSIFFNLYSSFSFYIFKFLYFYFIISCALVFVSSIFFIAFFSSTYNNAILLASKRASSSAFFLRFLDSINFI